MHIEEPASVMPATREELLTLRDRDFASSVCDHRANLRGELFSEIPGLGRLFRVEEDLRRLRVYIQWLKSGAQQQEARS